MRTTLPGEPPIEMQVRHAPRARRISLRVSGRDGLRDREPWLRRVLAEVQPMERPAPGGHLSVEGRSWPIVAAPVRRVALARGEVRVPGDRPAGPVLARFLKTLARHRAEASVARHAAELGRATPPLTLRDTRSRWGSCTAEGRLMLSWRLVMAPPEILDYVAAHEVAHLVHLDHSPRFWTVTERLYPGWRAARKWLRDEGGRLQAIDFT